MWLLLAWLVTGAPAAPPDPVRVGHADWTVEDGLPANGVTSLAQTGDGWLWVATFDGLVRFDGHRFTPVEPSRGRWPSRRLTTLQLDHRERLWIDTEAGHVLRYDPRDGTLDAWGDETRRPLSRVHLGDDGTVWVPGRDALLRLSDDDTFHPWPPLADVREPLAVVVHDGEVWLHARDGVHRVSPGGAREDWSRDALGIGRLSHVLPDGDGAWVAGMEGVVRVDDDAVEPLLVGDAPLAEEVIRLAPGPDGGLWLVTERGLLAWRDGTLSPPLGDDPHRPADRFLAAGTDGSAWVTTRTTVLRDGEVVARLPAEVRGISDVLVGLEGGAWIATTGGGLHRFAPTPFGGWSREDGLPSDNVYALLSASDGSLWVGTQRGSLARLDAQGVRSFGEDGLPEDVLALHEDTDGTLWVGSWDEGLWHGDAARGFRRVEALGPHATVRVLHTRADGTLWAGTGEGLFVREAGGWRRLDETLGLPSGVVRRLVEGDDGTVWAGTAGAGLLRIDPDGTTAWDADSALGSDQVRALWDDGEGGLWVGTEDAGLRHVGAEGPTGRGVGPSDGLPDHAVHALLDAGDGWLWGSTNHGLFRVRIDALRARGRDAEAPVRVGAFTERDGLLHREGNGGNGHSATRLPDGRLAFSSQGGVLLVHPDRVDEGFRPPRVVIDAVQVGDRSLAVTDGALTLPLDVRSFGIDLTAPSLRAGDRLRFGYALDGVDRRPVDAGARRTAWYTEVGPGTHVFHAWVTTPDGRRSPHEATLAVTVPPFLVETWPFRVAVAGLVLAGLVALVRVRFLALARRQEALEALVAQRTEALRAETEALERSRAVVAEQAAQLAEIDRVKTRYFANLSHEFRTPLTLVLGPLADVLAGRHGRVPDEAARQVSRAERSARRLFGLVNQLLDVVKIDAGALRLDLEVHDLAALAATAVDELSPLAERRGVALELSRPDGVVPAALDAREFPKVVTNLLSNALKHTPEGGRVAVRVDDEGDRVSLEVSDTGPGIAPEVRARLFERFFMAGDDTTVQPGTGLGLALARELTEAHGGTIGVDSEPGEGARFTVILPRAQGTPRPATPPVPEVAPLDDEALPTPTPEDDGDRTTVLVVDDHADLRDWIASQLAPRYRVLQAADGREGLRVARSRQPDVVITDLMMPGMDGHELAASLRADPALDGVALVMLTARGSVETHVEGLDRGVDVYLTKPFASEVLLAQVAQLVRQRQRLRERLREELEGPSEPPEERLSADERYVRRIHDLVTEHHADPDFGVQELADRAAQDRAHLYRRVKALTGESPSALIRRVRLERAARLLSRRVATVSEIAYGVGFRSVSYFSTAFRKHYGVPPSAWRPDDDPAGGPQRE